MGGGCWGAKEQSHHRVGGLSAGYTAQKGNNDKKTWKGESAKANLKENFSRNTLTPEFPEEHCLCTLSEWIEPQLFYFLLSKQTAFSEHKVLSLRSLLGRFNSHVCPDNSYVKVNYFIIPVSFQLHKRASWDLWRTSMSQTFLGSTLSTT